jgi:hypothetical protein
MRCQKTYTTFNPPLWLKMGHSYYLSRRQDFRVPRAGQEAFQAAQLRGIKSRFIYFPEENHGSLSLKTHKFGKKNFFKWLKETL